MLIQLVLCEGSDVNSTGFSSVTTCFFPLRRFPCSGKQPRDSAPYSIEPEKAKYVLKNFALAVEEKGGCLDITKLSWRWLEEPIWCNNVCLTVSHF